MTSNTLQKEIDEAIPKLLDLARELSWNNISNDCKFIMTEIKNSEENFHVQRVLRKNENDKKVPVSFSEIMPTLQNLYGNFHDINLHIYRAYKFLTIIDIRYFLKSSLDKNTRQKIAHNPPMLHYKVATPPWLFDKKKKFDINWEHKQWLTKWKLFWIRRNIEFQNAANI